MLSDFKEYHVRILHRSIRDAVQFEGMRKFKYKISASIVGASMAYLVFGQSTLIERCYYELVLLLIIAIMLAVYFLCHVFMAPIRIDKEQQRYIKELNEKLNRPEAASDI